MDDDDEGWGVWRHYVISELKRLNDNIEKLADFNTEIRIDVANLKLVAAIIGATAGIAGSVIALVFVTILG